MSPSFSAVLLGINVSPQTLDRLVSILRLVHSTVREYGMRQQRDADVTNHQDVLIALDVSREFSSFL